MMWRKQAISAMEIGKNDSVHSESDYAENTDSEGRDSYSAASRISFPPPATCNTALLRALLKANRVDEAWSWYRGTLGGVEDLTKDGVFVSGSTQWDREGRVDERPGGRQIASPAPGLLDALDRTSFLTVLSGCAKVGRWEAAVEVLHDMGRHGFRLDTSIYNTALSGWRACVGLMHLEGGGLRPPLV